MVSFVSINFDAEELIESLDESAEDAIADAAETVRMGFVNNTPSNRKETRRAIKKQVQATQAEVGIMFPSSKRHRTQGTKTERIAETAWRSSEQATFDTFEQSFSDQVERLNR